jgi:hypothetical protein
MMLLQEQLEVAQQVPSHQGRALLLFPRLLASGEHSASKSSSAAVAAVALPALAASAVKALEGYRLQGIVLDAAMDLVLNLLLQQECQTVPPLDIMVLRLAAPLTAPAAVKAGMAAEAAAVAVMSQIL